MIIETIKLNKIEIFPELFLGICIIYIFFYGTFIFYQNLKIFKFKNLEKDISGMVVDTVPGRRFVGRKAIYVAFANVNGNFDGLGSELVGSIDQFSPEEVYTICANHYGYKNVVPTGTLFRQWHGDHVMLPVKREFMVIVRYY